MALNAGDTLLNGHYRIFRQLGRGGFGFVFLAQDTLLGEQVAIKELIPALVGDESMLKRFLAEARATMRLSHERIVRTHNVFRESGNYYIVMECMAGGSLEARLRESGPLPVEEAVQVAAEVCEGLAYAHKRGIVHCDLKPANILFDRDGHAKVGDFGIAHVSGEMLTRSWQTPQGFVAGTLPYMSPEQAEGVRDEPRIDVYALGAVLYRMLTGRTYLDFDQRETPAAQADNVYRIRNQEPQPPSAHAAGLPNWVDGVVLRALAKYPEERYAGAEAMRAALLGQQARAAALPPRRLVSERKARPGQGERVMPPAKERVVLPAWFWPVAGIAGVLLVFLVLAIGTLVRNRDGAGTVPPHSSVTAVAVATTAIALLPTDAASPTDALTRIDTPTPSVTNTPTHTPRPTATAAPTSAPRTDTATFTPKPSPTPIPATQTPKPKTPASDGTKTRSKDGMVMVYVPAGEFLMGSSSADIDAVMSYCSACERDFFVDEQPQHTVFLDAFWIDRTEVTNAQYEACVTAGACQVADMSEYDPQGKPNHPVVQVTWNDARAYCQWAGARLPTEAEWEKAARGTDGRLYPWGNGAPDCGKAQYDLCAGTTASVGSLPAGGSPYGMLDAAGNVWEWVEDWYDASYYALSPSRNPLGPNRGEYRTVRGGSWNDGMRNMRPADRGKRGPSDRYQLIGFRCAATP